MRGCCALFGQHHFLLIATGQLADPLIDAGGTDIEGLHHATRLVAALDRKRKGRLISTLRTYLEKGSSLSLAAQALGVHVHTVQYRLNKLEELTQLNHRNAEDRLTLELALRVLDMSGADQSEPS